MMSQQTEGTEAEGAIVALSACVGGFGMAALSAGLTYRFGANLGTRVVTD